MTDDTCILIAGIGNIFLGDDAFGVEVARRLAMRPSPQGVRIVDFGIRGFDLVYALLDPYTAVILVDAVPRGEAPGTLYVIEPDIASLQMTSSDSVLLDAHSMHPEKVLQAALAMGAKLDRVILIGCEPMPFYADMDMQMQLSEPVQTAVDEAVKMIESKVNEILGDACPTASALAGSEVFESQRRQGTVL